MDTIASILGVMLAFSSMWFAWYLMMPGLPEGAAEAERHD